MGAAPSQPLSRKCAMTLKKPSRNDQCPCGSGKKYKQCCSRLGGGQSASPAPATGEIANALPALSAKGVSLGSFNRLAKVSAQAYKAWAQVLLAIPGSTMVLKAPNWRMPDREIESSNISFRPELVRNASPCWGDHPGTITWRPLTGSTSRSTRSRRVAV